MVWLDLAENNGSGLYLDVRKVEWRQQRGGRICAVTGMLGDGLYEGDILVEVGGEVDVTFADQWLAPQRLNGFFSRVDRFEVEAALESAARELAGALAGAGRGRRDEPFVQPAPSPHPVHAQLELLLPCKEGAVHFVD